MTEIETKKLLQDLEDIVESYGDQLQGMTVRDKKMFGLGIYCGCHLQLQLMNVQKKNQNNI